MFHHVRIHRGALHRGRAHSELAVAIDEQHPVKAERLAGLGFEAFDFQRVACRDAILFATGF